MLADTNKASRFQNLTRLEISDCLKPSCHVRGRAHHVANELAQVFRYSHRLQYLTIRWCESLVNTSSLVHAAVSGLSAIRELVLGEVGESTVDLLMDMHAPLTYLKLVFDADVFPDPPYPFTLLQNS